MYNTRSHLTYSVPIILAHDKEANCIYTLLLLTFKSRFYQTPNYLYDNLLLQRHHGLTMRLRPENTRQLYIYI